MDPGDGVAFVCHGPHGSRASITPIVNVVASSPDTTVDVPSLICICVTKRLSPRFGAMPAALRQVDAAVQSRPLPPALRTPRQRHTDSRALSWPTRHRARRRRYRDGHGATGFAVAVGPTRRRGRSLSRESRFADAFSAPTDPCFWFRGVRSRPQHTVPERTGCTSTARPTPGDTQDDRGDHLTTPKVPHGGFFCFTWRRAGVASRSRHTIPCKQLLRLVFV